MDIGAFVGFMTDPGNLIALVAAVLVFATILTLSLPALSGNDLEKRIKSVANRREELRRKSREALKEGGLRDAKKSPYRKIVESLKLQELLEDPNLKQKLSQAGMRGQSPVFAFYFARFALPFAFGGFAAVYLFFINDLGMPSTQRMVGSIGAAVLGFYAPGVYLQNAAAKRRESIMQAFPDALDLLLICVESGMSIEAAFQKVASEVGSASIELAEELSLTTAELSYLQERRLAYENLAYRTNHPGVKAVATSLIQAERYGTPLGQALRVMAKENRDMRMSAAEKKASALPAQLTVPMILFFLPVLFVVILGPAGIQYAQG